MTSVCHISFTQTDDASQKLQIVILLSKVYCRLTKIELYLNNNNIFLYFNKKEEKITKIKSSFEDIEKKINDRKEYIGNYYDWLMAEYNNSCGEFYFNFGNFYMECNNRNETQKYYNNAQDYYGNAEKHYIEALEYYEKYPDRYMVKYADVLKNMADLFCKKNSDAIQRKECYELLIRAYILYRKGSDLYGIANVLQSLGNAEYFFDSKNDREKRSPLSFYDMAINLYKTLGDDYSYNITKYFREKLYNKINSNKSVGDE